MQYCPKCGGEMRGAMNFCPYCGAMQPKMQNILLHTQMESQQVNQSVQLDPIAEEQLDFTHNFESEKKNKLGLGSLLSLIFCLILQPLGFIMAVFSYFTAKFKDNHTNKVLAKAGLIVSIIQLFILIFVCLVLYKVYAADMYV